MTARLSVRLTPNARVDAIDGWVADEAGRPYLKARVRAQAIEGRANGALEQLIAAALDIPTSRVRVARGATSRLKQLEIDGLEPDAARLRLGG